MNLLKMACALTLGVSLTACGSSEVVTRAAPLSSTTANIDYSVKNFQPTPELLTAEAMQAAIVQQINVSQINVNVPTSLKVSEANRYYPSGDIVWREDPIGDRHAQVGKILKDAMLQGTASFQGSVPIILDIQLVRFHALSEKARYTVGGVHHVVFDMILRDAKTGAVLSPPRRIETDLAAFGGQQAKTAEANGQTQKRRLTNHLAEVIRQQMVKPAGYENASLGFFQLVNRI
ncbi:DUF6778 family protein [Sulfitobacter guttiformis]|uniref:Lipoprotein n=1 Tax=Sulfitobacter guttiformis TaxID=74349 RepID=A0A420DIG4_9RHOB|nr:DUF6778 family protein [Sulfitobacter guttiformis]KIN72228.1 putative lipoprotein [Sulfitobacter guttiformis KCTC 32187]RKE94002.1 hypothetical protein C8N30_3107 [Sulfitobacter guttiformis]